MYHVAWVGHLLLSLESCTNLQVLSLLTLQWISTVTQLWHVLLVGQSVELTLVHEIEFVLEAAAKATCNLFAHYRLDWVLSASAVHFVHLGREFHLVVILIKFNLVLVSICSTLLACGLMV